MTRTEWRYAAVFLWQHDYLPEPYDNMDMDKFQLYCDPYDILQSRRQIRCRKALYSYSSIVRRLKSIPNPIFK